MFSHAERNHSPLSSGQPIIIFQYVALNSLFFFSVTVASEVEVLFSVIYHHNKRHKFVAAYT